MIESLCKDILQLLQSPLNVSLLSTVNVIQNVPCLCHVYGGRCCYSNIEYMVDVINKIVSVMILAITETVT